MVKPRILVLAAMASVGLAACGSSTTGTAPSKPDKVQIAAEGPFTGDEASIGAGALRGIRLAVKDFNNSGGVHGTQVNLVPWDDQHNSQTATTFQAQGFSDPTILGVVGPMNSSQVLATEPGLQSANPPLPFVTESASAIKVTEGGYTVAHRVNARDDKQAALDGQFMIDKGAKKIEILDSGTDYSRPLADAVESYLKAHASTVQTKRDVATNGQTNFTTVVTNMKAFNADWVFFADEGSETAPLVQQMKQAKLNIGQNINFLGTDGEDDSSIITKSQGAYLGAYASNVTADPQSVSTAASFVAGYKAEYGANSISDAGPFYGSAYAATQVLLQAIANAPVNNGKISRKDVLSHLGSDTFNTILGPIKYDSKGDVTNVTIGIFQAQGTIAAPTMVAVKSLSG